MNLLLQRGMIYGPAPEKWKGGKETLALIPSRNPRIACSAPLKSLRTRAALTDRGKDEEKKSSDNTRTRQQKTINRNVRPTGRRSMIHTSPKYVFCWPNPYLSLTNKGAKGMEPLHREWPPAGALLNRTEYRYKDKKITNVCTWPQTLTDYASYLLRSISIFYQFSLLCNLRQVIRDVTFLHKINMFFGFCSWNGVASSRYALLSDMALFSWWSGR